MVERLENKCRTLIEKREYEKCEKEIRKAMSENPHSAVPHNLMGILLEEQDNHVLAMKHFRAAYGLDPTYIPARYNLEQHGQAFFKRNFAYTQEDCPVDKDTQFKIVYDENNVGHMVRK